MLTTKCCNNPERILQDGAGVKWGVEFLSLCLASSLDVDSVSGLCSGLIPIRDSVLKSRADSLTEPWSQGASEKPRAVTKGVWSLRKAGTPAMGKSCKSSGQVMGSTHKHVKGVPG